MQVYIYIYVCVCVCALLLVTSITKFQCLNRRVFIIVQKTKLDHRMRLIQSGMGPQAGPIIVKDRILKLMRTNPNRSKTDELTEPDRFTWLVNSIFVLKKKQKFLDQSIQILLNLLLFKRILEEISIKQSDTWVFIIVLGVEKFQSKQCGPSVFYVSTPKNKCSCIIKTYV